MLKIDPFRQALRKTFQNIRSKLSSAYQKESSLQITKSIRNLEEYRYAKRVALYQAFNGEVDLTRLWQSAPQHGKYCYFPVLNDDRTLFSCQQHQHLLFIRIVLVLKNRW